jgi:peptide-methionine (S)-S-oxide reductase
MSLLARSLIAVCACLSISAVLLAQRQNVSAGPKIGTHPGGIGLNNSPLKPAPGDELAAFSGGCFWGTENAFRHVPGVVATAVGYTGGTVPNPTYEQVCTHTTGHAETVLVEFNPKKVSYNDLLSDFWKMHDPTTVDRQGPDVGNSYRSAIWCYSNDELQQAIASRKAAQRNFQDPIVTTISLAKPFYMAEDYHQQYDEKTGTNTCPTFIGKG